MDESTHTPPSRTEPIRDIRWCHWHEDVTTDDVLLIGAHERVSGPPAPVYACAGCRKTHRLVPLVERLP